MSVIGGCLICSDPDLPFGGNYANTSFLDLYCPDDPELELIIYGDLWLVELLLMSSIDMALYSFLLANKLV